MRKYIVILNTVKYNRGSEALARGFSEIIHHFEPDADIKIVSNDIDIERLAPIPYTTGFISKSSVTRKNIVLGLIYTALKKVFKCKSMAASLRYSKLLQQCANCDVIVCFGGDNYDIHYNMIDNLHELHSILKKRTNGKMVMYDCSFGENDITEAVIEDISQFDIITVREKTSMENLGKRYSGTNVRYFPDPAFAMSPEPVALPDAWEKGRMVGINLSGLILEEKYGGDATITFQAYVNLVRSVIKKGYIPVFVPHVMNGQDYLPLKKLYDECKKYGKMLLISEEYNAAQLKYIISNCSMFIGARTHSTIAAYSSCVPTLVIGYSVKSVGIATDLFGTDDDYVISVDSIKNDNQLVEGFEWLDEHVTDIRKRLKQVMPEYIKAAYDCNQIIIKTKC